MMLGLLLLVSVQGEIAITEGLALPSVGRYGRDPFPVDALQQAMVLGSWRKPSAGEQVVGLDGKPVAWETLKAGSDGAFAGPAMRGGYLYAAVESPVRKVMILEASGHGMAYVNGEPRAGDVYGYGFVKLPVQLKQGRNDLLFQVPRGRLSAKLTIPKGDAFFNAGDPTLPDYSENYKPEMAAIVVVNATSKPLTGLNIESAIGSSAWLSEVPVISPLTSRKVGFKLPDNVAATADPKLVLKLMRGKDVLDQVTLDLRRREAGQTQKRTFVSDIDGSVQYYAVVPRASKEQGPGTVVLSLHGASVEAIGQADAYSAKDWATILCPTNRRPYGFDWEDWGRLDAVEVASLEPYASARKVVTGHSMGGHGAWQLGVNLPDMFEAVGPSAGWISFFSYAGGKRYEDPDKVEQILARSMNPSDTLALARNLIGKGVYILHGEADDNVPVTEARKMRDELSKFLPDLLYHEQPGAGHWWDVSPEPGADCVDWKPMFEMFKARTSKRPSVPSKIELYTFDPAISWRRDWVGIYIQSEPMNLSSAVLDMDPSIPRVTGATSNVQVLAIDLPVSGDPNSEAELILDGQALRAPLVPRVWLEKINNQWSVLKAEPAKGKSPFLAGPFRNAFRNRMVLVYGTKGLLEENEWAYAKARFDAETFWYRGNGSVDVISDADYDPVRFAGRNVILYGNTASNSQWKKLLKGSAIEVNRGWLRIGPRVIRGTNLGAMFAVPGAGGMVGVITGTGPSGMRATDRLPLFLSGAAYPDWVVVGTDMWTLGSKGVRSAGFFGNDWQPSWKDSAFR